MVKKSMYMKIKKLKRQGKSRRCISRELGLDKKTVEKYFDVFTKDHTLLFFDHLM